MCFEGKWLQNRLRGENNKSRPLLAVDIRGHQRGGFCIRRSISSSSSHSVKCALRESGGRIGCEATKTSRDHFWRSMSRDTNLEVSALSQNNNDNVKKGIEKYIRKIPGSISMQETQKCIILGATSTLRRSLSIE